MPTRFTLPRPLISGRRDERPIPEGAAPRQPQGPEREFLPGFRPRRPAPGRHRTLRTAGRGRLLRRDHATRGGVRPRHPRGRRRHPQRGGPGPRGNWAALGILPLGTANDLARSLGLPVDPVEAARLITTEEARPADLGWVNGHYYFNVASIGFSADLAGDLTAESKKTWGTLGYGIAAVRGVAADAALHGLYRA